MPCSHEKNVNDSAGLRLTLVFSVHSTFFYSTESLHGYQSGAVAYYFSILSYCALLHNTCVCKRNEYYLGGSRELRFSYSYEATVAKSQYLRRSGLIPREIVCLFIWAGFSLVLLLEICRSRQRRDLSKTA